MSKAEGAGAPRLERPPSNLGPQTQLTLIVTFISVTGVSYLSVPSASVPLLLVTSMSLVLKQSFVSGLLLDLPGTAVLSHDVEPGDGGAVRRRVVDWTGVVYDDRTELDHACLSCAVRGDLVPTIAQLAQDGRWAQLVVALPVGAEPQPVVALLEPALKGSGCGPAALAAVVSLVNPSRLVDDLFGADLMAERGLAMGEKDRRAVGEALAHQMEGADVVATGSEAQGREAVLLQHLAPLRAQVRSWNELDGADLLQRRFNWDKFHQRSDPLLVAPAATDDDEGVWTLDLMSVRPFHPARLRERIEELGLGSFRSRGRFWLPTRPRTVCAWDGAGGQLSIGNAGSWASSRPSTRLVVTGIDPAERQRVAAAFDEVLVTPGELAAIDWTSTYDSFGAWLDAYSTAA